MIQITAKLIAIGNSKLIDPATYKLADLKELVAHADTPVAIGELPYPLLEFMQCFRVPFDQATLECKTQEFTVTGFQQFQAVTQTLCHIVQDSLTRLL